LVTLSREICLGSDTVFMQSGAKSARKPKSRAQAEVRASVVAGKRGNARGAKGRRKVGSVNDKDSEKQSAVVLLGAKKAEEICGRWPWMERSVWSERLLAGSENGVEVAEAILRGSGFQSEDSTKPPQPISIKRPPTGKPDAGKPPVRFGGRGEVQTLVPTPIKQGCWNSRAVWSSGFSRFSSARGPPEGGTPNKAVGLARRL
jgi:hypothetical protein